MVASAFAGLSIHLAGKRPDSCHPYGHGKIEFFSAGFEGALIILAAVGIFSKAWPQIWHPQGLPQLSSGLAILLGASLINLILGLTLMKVGRPTHPLALFADGKHILTDVYSSAAVLLGLGLVWWTRLVLAGRHGGQRMGVAILVTGSQLVRQAYAGLMDTSEPRLLRGNLRHSGGPPEGAVDSTSTASGPAAPATG